MIRLRLFGPIELSDGNGTPRHSVVSHAKHVALLGYALIAQRGAHRRTRLTALLWPDLDDVRARNALSKALHHLRRALGDDLFLSHGDDAIEVDATRVWCDVTAFAEAAAQGRHEEAIALYQRGAFFEGFHVDGLSELEQWIDVERVRLRQRAVQSAAARSDDAHRGGDRDESVRWARVACELAPHDEVALRRLVARQAEAGDRAGAIGTFNEFASRLARDLDIAPSAETIALVERIRAESAPAARAANGTVVLGEREASTAPSANRQPSSPPPAPVPSSDGDGERAPSAASRPRRSARRLTIGLTGIAAALAISMALLWSHARARDADNHLRVGSLDAVRRFATAQASYATSSATLPGHPHLVLVVPWTNETGDTANVALWRIAADCIGERLQRNALADVVEYQALWGALKSSGPTAAGAPPNIAALARRTDATLALTGDVFGRGDSVQVWMKLVDARSGAVVRALPEIGGSPRAPEPLLADLCSRGLGAVAQAVDGRTDELITHADRPPTYEAYREYAAGLDSYRSRPGGNPTALAHFLRATQLDSNFVLPLIWAAHAVANGAVRHDSGQVLYDSVIAIMSARRDRLSPLEQLELQYLEADNRDDLSGRHDAAVQAARLAPYSQWIGFAVGTSWRLRRYREAITIMHRRGPGWVGRWNGYARALLQSHHLLGEYEQELGDIALMLQNDSAARVFSKSRLLLPPLIALGRDRDVEAVIDTVSTLPDWQFGVLLDETIAEARVHHRDQLVRRLTDRCLRWFQDHPSAADSSYKSILTAARANCFSEAGRVAEARGLLSGSCAEPASWHEGWDCDYFLYGTLSARLGDTVEVSRMRRDIAQLAARRHELSADPVMFEAYLAAIRGERERAVELLQRAISFRGISPLTHTEMALSSLQGYAPFERLITPPQ